MAVSQQLDKSIAIFKSMIEKGESAGTIDGFRLAFEETMAQFTLDDDVTCHPTAVGGVPGEWISAPNAAEDRALLYLHGGGYVIGSMRGYRDMLSRLSRTTGARVLGIEYRLAPEFPFPAAVNDSVAAYRDLLAQGFDPKKIVVAGESAGGGLTIATMVALRYLGEPLPACAVCMSPWVDLEGIGESMTANAEIDPVVGREMLDFMAGLYLGDKDRRTPLAAPLYADLRDLPPLLIQVGTAETLIDDSNRLAERAKAAGVEVELETWEDMIHAWQIFAPILPEAQQAIDGIGAFVKKHVG